MTLKPRQIGVSTGHIIDMLDDCLHTPNLTACILAHEKDAVEKLFRIAKRAYNFLPTELKPAIDGKGSKYEMHFPNLGSRIYCDLESRGDTIHRLHISEAAFVKDTSRILATLEAVPIDGRVTIETTANGIGNWFHDNWVDPDQEYAKFFFPWYLMLEYQRETKRLRLTEDEKVLVARAKKDYGIKLTHEQIAWRRWKLKDLKGMFFQEYPEDPHTCFLSSGSNVMDLFKVQEAIDRAIAPVTETSYLRAFKKYDSSREYVIGADTSEGASKGDWSVGTIFDARSREQIARIRGKWRPQDFAHKLAELAFLYWKKGKPWPLLAVERNNHGHAVLLELEEHIGYHNLYRHRDGKLGWLTDRVTRPLMFDAVVDGVENNTVTLHDKDTLGECLTLIDNNGKPEAAPGKHDDCVVAAAIATQMCIECSVGAVYENIENRIRI